MMELTTLWFVLITVLFTGFFILEGFDYGVGTLFPFISEKKEDRRMVLRTIGPVWDGNEVWMITAGGALFAAFPHVYATMFSTFYFALFLMLLALIVRGVAFELRGRYDSDEWRRYWDGAIFFGSALPAVLWGVAVTDLFKGLPIDEHMVYTGTFFDLLSAHSVLGGLAFFLVFAYHGASFLTLRLADAKLLGRARKLAKHSGGWAILVFVLFIFMTFATTDFLKSLPAVVLLLGAALVFVLGYLAMLRGCGKGLCLHGALPEAHGLQPESRLEPDHHQRVIHALHPFHHDNGGSLPRAGGSPLSGMDLLDLQETGIGRRPQTRTLTDGAGFG